MADVANSPVVFLDVYLNSTVEHSPFELTTPVVNTALGFYWPFGQNTNGYKPWRSEWSVLDPSPTHDEGQYWNPGLRILTVPATKSSSGYTPVSGETVAIRVWDYPLEESGVGATNGSYWVQIVAEYRDHQKKPRFVDPSTVLASYAVSDGSSVSMPPGEQGTEGGPCVCLVFSRPFPVGTKGEQSHAKLSSIEIASFCLADLSQTEYTDGLVRISVAVFAAIPTSSGIMYFYDDPEMDVNVP